jgi:hypothetical protein
MVGVKTNTFDIVSWDTHSFCITCFIRNKADGGVWRFVLVYGPAYDEFKLDFINELHNVFSLLHHSYWDDFNLIRESKEKSNGNINQHWANLFNDWINKFDLFKLRMLVENLLGSTIKIN